MFQTSFVHPQEHSCIWSMVRFICIGVSSLMGTCFRCISVSSLVGRTPTHQTAYTDACKTYHTANTTAFLTETHSAHQTAYTDARKTYHTANTTVFLKMNPQGLKHVQITKIKYEFRKMCILFVLYNHLQHLSLPPSFLILFAMTP
jgi:uncharacterized cupredoxin-like copper-binding protein